MTKAPFIVTKASVHYIYDCTVVCIHAAEILWDTTVYVYTYEAPEHTRVPSLENWGGGFTHIPPHAQVVI